jgi:hypothetical protein
MLTTRKVPLLLCLLCLLVRVNLATQQTLSPSELAGTYYAGHNYGGSSITLRADGSYSDNSGSCTLTTEESGTYLLTDGVLQFKILKFTGKQNGSEQEVDLFDPQARREFFGYRDDEKLEPLKTEYALLLLKWGERIYLVDEKDLGNFTSAINFGLEPRGELKSEPYYGSFYLREGDVQKEVTGRPSLPEKWLAFLLHKPVVATIVDIEEDGQERIATIDKGSRAGLKAGMKLVGKDEEPSPWTITALFSVEAKSAKMRVGPEAKVGDKLSTKYERKDLDQ